MLGEIDEFRSAQDLFEALRGRGEDVGLTTVYRTLQSLADAGEVDMDTAPALRAAVIACIDQVGGQPCVLDLTKVTFLSSAGLTVLLEATSHSEARRQPLPIVVDSNRPVIRPIQVTGLDDVLTLYHTVDEALHASDR